VQGLENRERAQHVYDEVPVLGRRERPRNRAGPGTERASEPETGSDQEHDLDPRRHISDGRR
jgi:hypothetical protein